MQLFASLGIAAGVKLTDPKQFDLNLHPEQNSLGNFIRANSSGASQEIFWGEKKVAAYRLMDFQIFSVMLIWEIVFATQMDVNNNCDNMWIKCGVIRSHPQ